MSFFVLSLLKQYKRDPGQVWRHLRKAREALSEGGLARLRDFYSHAIVANAAENRMSAALGRFAEAERIHARVVAEWTRAILAPERRPEMTGMALHDAKEAVIAAYRACGLFDEAYYVSRYMSSLPEDHGLSPMEHFMLHGRYGGCNPNPYFDYTGYLLLYPDVASGGLDPCLHYTFFGWKEGRRPGPDFDAQAYLRQNLDVAAAKMNPFHHFMSSGRAEGRDPLPKVSLTPTTPPPARSFGKERGTIVLVSHDGGVGGAQKVVQYFARWVQGRTGYEVKLVTMKGGGLLHEFREIAPTFNIADHPEETVAEALAEFCGPHVRAVFLNSVSSGGFLKHWQASVPVVAYIHELSKLLGAHPEELGLIRDRATTIIGGSEAVRRTLLETYHFKEAHLDMVPAFIEKETGVKNDVEKADAKRALDIDPDMLVVAACGVMHWRKSPELFIEVAETVLARTERPLRFIWVGGGPDYENCQALIDQKGLQDRVTLTGYEPDVQRYLDASDVFLLPSEEDPFPLVCLMAALARSPVICFQDAGGMPELVEQGCGIAVPFLDVEAMAEATLSYLEDGGLRSAHGQRGRDLVREGYTIDSAGPRLFALLRAAAGLKPAVSVVVPNYNYEDYLPQRLETIYAQTFQDFEVILLDDRSTDGSIAVLEAWSAKRSATRLVANEENSGSPFAQWIRGMEMAESDLIWIAEADDFCEPTLLETLLPAFQDRNVFLGYVKSVPVNSQGDVQGDYEELYLDRINPGRWSQSYVVTDHEEASLGLGIANCIPNGSSVIFRRFEAEDAFRDQVIGMRMCGDWLYYLRAMRGGLVAYVDAPLNYHRRHGSTVTSQTEGSPMYFGELQAVRDYVQDHYRLSEEARSKILTFTRQDLERFAVTDRAVRKDVLESAGRLQDGKVLPSVLFVAPDLSPGGGQMFVIRLANAWTARGGRAVLINAGHAPTHEKVLSLIDVRVTLVREDDPQMADLAGLCASYDIDLIHSSIWWADKYVRGQIENLPGMPWVTSMHGCHETILAHPGVDPQFPGDIAFMQARLDAWVYTADKNLAVFHEYGEPLRSLRIPNGVAITLNGNRSRAELQLRESAVVLCLATRAIESKGWFAAVEMVERLNAEGLEVDLMLIGEGPARDEIAARVPENVHLYGHVDDLHDYVALCDIGILPSSFVGESMPLVLLEMMGLGKPVVATDVGEISEMVGTAPEAGGLLVPLRDGNLDIEAFTNALRCLVRDAQLRQTCGRRAHARFEARYREEVMVDAYAALYKNILTPDEVVTGTLDVHEGGPEARTTR